MRRTTKKHKKFSLLQYIQICKFVSLKSKLLCSFIDSHYYNMTLIHLDDHMWCVKGSKLTCSYVSIKTICIKCPGKLSEFFIKDRICTANIKPTKNKIFLKYLMTIEPTRRSSIIKWVTVMFNKMLTFVIGKVLNIHKGKRMIKKI